MSRTYTDVLRICFFLEIICFFLGHRSISAENASAEKATSGIAKRIPWTTSRIFGAPTPPLPYTTERAFPQLKFNNCLDISSAPGTDRLFIVEQGGKIFSFENKPDVEKADLVADFAKEISGVQSTYAITFHPDFERNRYCYVCYIKAPNLPDGTWVSRFRVNESNPPTIDVASEVKIVSWLSGGHNGCSLKFGPDGYLYISTGDAGPANPPDILKTGQDISDLLSSILRVDVDQSAGELNYRIPSDNPFVNTKGARGEIWAYGLRNPWRMSFDRKTGDLWVGDVGWELWEMLYRIEKGGNYGWAITEGRQTTHPEWPRGPTSILPPTIDHLHTESSSITDGLTYYGTRLKDLYGTHIYGDYDTGKFWGFRFENGKVVDHRELADTTHRIVGFGETNDGDFVLLDHTAGTVHRMLPNPQPDQSSSFPRKLSDSGLFESVSKHTPAAGVVPYSINAEPWADYALSQRFVGIPGELSVTTSGANWTFPKDAVLAKTFSLDLRTGDISSRRRIETQILHFDGLEWQPYTYQWTEDQSDALLVSGSGAERVLEIADPDALGGKRRQVWRFAGRAECQRCHNRWSGPVLAFNIAQLHKNHSYTSGDFSQLDSLAHVKLLDQGIPEDKRTKLVNPRDAEGILESRARAYLHTNCSHCHRMHAGGAVLSQMQYDLALNKTSMVSVRPTQGTFGMHSAQVIAPGDPYRSVLWYRMAKLGGGRMPHIGSTEVDREGLRLIHDWLTTIQPQAANSPDKDANSKDVEGSAAPIDTVNLPAISQRRAADLAAIKRLASTHNKEQLEIVSDLLGSTSSALLLYWAIENREMTPQVVALVVQSGVKHDDVTIRDLFERFVPAEQRVQRLGSRVDPRQILSLSGDTARGRQVFFQTAGVACKNCHQIKNEGKQIGPDLSAIGKKLNREQLLESLLEPSKRIDPQFVTYLVETSDGQVLTGILVSRDDQHVVLKDAQDKSIRLPQKSIEKLVPQLQSLMPDLLLRDLTAQQVADLLAYMSSLQ